MTLYTDEQQEEKTQKKQKIRYLSLNEYDEFFDFFIKQRTTFLVEHTSYTKKIKQGNQTLIFNEKGESDYTILALINKVRNDAKKWFDKNPLPKINENDIIWSRLTEKPPQTIITKIDLSGAYWQAALKRGIITTKTHDYLTEKYTDVKEQKQARLKALGSLATKKKVVYYSDGREYDRDQKIQYSRQMYMSICQDIDKVMSDICFSIPGAYFYYWDCIFTGNESTNEVIDYILRKQYHHTTEEAEQTVEEIGLRKYIVCTEPEKIFLKRKEIEPINPITGKEIEPDRKVYSINPDYYSLL